MLAAVFAGPQLSGVLTSILGMEIDHLTPTAVVRVAATHASRVGTVEPVWLPGSQCRRRRRRAPTPCHTQRVRVATIHPALVSSPLPHIPSVHAPCADPVIPSPPYRPRMLSGALLSRCVVLDQVRNRNRSIGVARFLFLATSPPRNTQRRTRRCSACGHAGAKAIGPKYDGRGRARNNDEWEAGRDDKVGGGLTARRVATTLVRWAYLQIWKTASCCCYYSTPCTCHIRDLQRIPIETTHEGTALMEPLQLEWQGLSGNTGIITHGGYVSS